MKFCKKCNIETARHKCGRCVPCAKAMSVAWQKANPEKSKRNSSGWKKANPEKLAAMKFCKKCQVETKRHKNGSCKPCVKLYGAARYKINPEKQKALNAAWHKANPEKTKAISAAYRKANPESKILSESVRRAKNKANGGKLSKGLTDKLFTLQNGKCPCCKQPLGDDYHLDHIMPIDLGGANEDWNIQLLRATCNQQKHAKHPIDFMQSRGFLI